METKYPTERQALALKSLESLHIAACDGNIEHPGYVADEQRLREFIEDQAELLKAAEQLYLKTIVGTDAERHAALDNAWAAIAKATGQ